jgi:hypothetical protein
MVKIFEQFPVLPEEKEKPREKLKSEEEKLQSQLLRAEFQAFLEKKEISLKHKDFIRIMDRYDGESKYTEEMKILGMSLAMIEDCPEKEIFTRLFIKASLGLNNYGEAFSATEFIKNNKEKEEIKTGILENRINYFKNYFENELKLPDNVGGTLLQYFKDYKSIPCIYPTGEKVKWPIVYTAAQRFFKKIAEKSQLPWEWKEKTLLEWKEKALLEWEKPAGLLEWKPRPAEIKEKTKELKKAGLFEAIKKYGLIPAGGLALIAILFLIAPFGAMAVGFYTGIKELITGFKKEFGLEGKKKEEKK